MDRQAALCMHMSVLKGGVEPPRPFGHTDLNRARLPIPPLELGRLRGDLQHIGRRRVFQVRRRCSLRHSAPSDSAGLIRLRRSRSAGGLEHVLADAMVGKGLRSGPVVSLCPTQGRSASCDSLSWAPRRRPDRARRSSTGRVAPRPSSGRSCLPRSRRRRPR